MTDVNLPSSGTLISISWHDEPPDIAKVVSVSSTGDVNLQYVQDNESELINFIDNEADLKWQQVKVCLF